METTTGIATDYRNLFMGMWSIRKERNASFSLRTFARHLGLSAATLSLVLAGKRELSIKQLKTICSSQCLTEKEKAQLLQSLLGGFLGEEGEGRTVKPLSADRFRAIADWKHYAVLSLAELPKNSARATWIARELEIPIREARDIFERLLRLGFIVRKGNRFRRAVEAVRTTEDIPDEAIRQYHRSTLARAEASLGRDGVETRDFSAITMAVNPDRLPEAKAAIRKFRNEIYELLSQGEKRSVYLCSLQLFPLTLTKRGKS